MNVDQLQLSEHRDEILETVESALISLGVGGIGAMVGIGVYASRVEPRVCTGDVPSAFSACSSELIGTANHFAGIAGKGALLAAIAGGGVMLYRDRLAGGDE